MKPVVTLILLALIASAVAYFLLHKSPENPRVEQFVDCYVDLAIYQEAADSVSATFYAGRDSVLAAHGFDKQSFMALKDSLDQTPEYLVNVWDKIEAELKARDSELNPTK